MNEGVEPRPGSVGTRWVLPCGHRWTLPWGLPPEAAAAELLRHQTACDLDPGVPLPGGLWPSPGTWLVPTEVKP
jgi:hypothetical protein